ncbi:hypothetical protein [Nocardia callitridis]|uniref:Secreted protein n=1 Tax=Nocardia callitridis TaxID=648753 RepID=A0ABP9JW58_9NOCA
MSIRTTATRLITATALVAAPLALAAAPAAAESDQQSWDTIFTLANSGLCGARIDPSVGHGGLADGGAIINFQTTMWGVGDCRVTVTGHWSNLDNGRTGTVVQEMTGTGYRHYGAEPHAVTGPGHVVVSFEVDGAHLPQNPRGEWVMPDYENGGN